MQATSPSPSGNILPSASQIVISGGSFVGSQNNVTMMMKERLEQIYEQVAPNAILNAGGRADEVKCFPGTRQEVLAKIEAWIAAAKAGNDHDCQRRIFWLSGPAGAEKSVIVQTLAERCIARNLPMTNFFFFRGDYTRSNARPVVATLLCQLLDTYPTLKPLLEAILVNKPLIFSRSLHDQFRHLIQNPVRAIREVSVDQGPIIILIDGLDEYYRPSDDIRLFVVAELARIKNTHHLRGTLDEHWPSESSTNAIVDKSSGQFIYAATVLRFITNSSACPALSLDKVLGVHPVKKSSPFAELDAIYTHILSQVEDWEATKDVLAAQFFYHHRLNGEVLKFYHASLSDFLRDKTRSGGYHIAISAFTEKVAPEHIRAIRDFDSLLLSLLLVINVRQPTSSINEALTSHCPPHFEWPNTEMDVNPVIIRFL
ncbi:hypothetical protein D9619_004106 [Psilocybe cf. subviscida]|uniref:NACHT domain-containing protein n=1 Tax=Psilocybe cf. subviscida TaxID=2480587 RepID=A0A8H5BP58_9AGAR|nr:hypothetical protein D9619_004106 [Psilocybe cf. subviscida]